MTQLTFDQFEGRTGETFTARIDGEEYVLTLKRTEIQSSSTETRSREPFSLFFTGPILQQGTYFLKHAELGEWPIFLVPIGRNHAGSYEYQAAFN